VFTDIYVAGPLAQHGTGRVVLARGKMSRHAEHLNPSWTLAGGNSVPACIPRTRLRHGELFADIIEDRRDRSPVLMCVVQKQGSPEILFLGQFRSRTEAKIDAERLSATIWDTRRSSP
jgi:hypothetical protein